MSTNYTRWYRVGKASVTNGSVNVTGSETFWASVGLLPGDMFSVDNGDNFYEIASITDNTHLVLKTAFRGTTDSASDYSITRIFTATMPAQIAAQTSDLILDMRRYLDADMQTLKGKSAYECAVELGFNGTESAWLESLIGAGQWNTLDTRTKWLNDISKPLWHRLLYRGKYLGTEITAAQWEEIRTQRFTDMYCGDFWVLDIPGFTCRVQCRIVDFMYFPVEKDGATTNIGPHIVCELRNGGTRTGEKSCWALGLMHPDLCELWDESDTSIHAACRMNDTNSTTGGFAGSKMFTEKLPMINEWLVDYFGSHIKAHKVSISNAVTDGKVSGWMTAKDQYAMLPSIDQLTGTLIDAHLNWGYPQNSQFAMFRHEDNQLWPNRVCWTRSVGNARAYYHPYFYDGPLSVNDATNAESWARGQLCPYVILGV